MLVLIPKHAICFIVGPTHVLKHGFQDIKKQQTSSDFTQLSGKSSHDSCNLDLVSAASLAATVDPHPSRHMSLTQK